VHNVERPAAPGGFRGGEVDRGERRGGAVDADHHRCVCERGHGDLQDCHLKRHAAARLDEQTILIVATAAHQASAAAWIGGLPYLLLTLRSCDDVLQAASVCRRFSRLAVVSVSLLFAAGLVLSKLYIGDASGLYGTTYGIMVAAKVLLFGLILLLGSLNFRLIRNRSGSDIRWLKQLRRISEAEIGIGITVILAAASLTSQPPAIDLTKNRVSLSTIARRMAPQVPRMSTPPLSTLSPSTRELWKRQHSSNVDTIQTYIPGQEPSVPPTEGDIAWSEYNHHWAGLIVLVMGVLAAFARYRRFAYAKHWPLAFIGLAVFLLVRADPENWPLGPNGFWESFTSADVAQHRLFVLLIVLFAVFEARKRKRRPSLVYCGDSEKAKKSVATLIRDVGFDAVDAGPLEVARYTEPFTLLIAKLAYEGDDGPALAYRFEHYEERS